MPLSPTATRALLARLGHAPRRSLGQNFLIDGNIVRKSLALAAIQPGDRVVEVGPGLGTLTETLLEAGAQVWAIEFDPALFRHLASELAPRYGDRLCLLQGDAVEHPLAGLLNSLSPFGANSLSPPPFKIVANLPYAIATPWLDGVLSGPLPERMVLMVQKEAAERYAAAPGQKAFGAISVFLQAAYDIAPGHRVAAACFYPKPEVESYLFHLARKPTPAVLPQGAKDLVRACFRQRRKQIGALLRAHAPGQAAAWLELLGSQGLTNQTRPEAIPVAAWLRLFSPAA